MTDQPDIILIMCDQMRYDCAGFMGHPIVRTPVLDRLAAEGTVVDHAYCASPVCSPARASWLTGVYPHAHAQLANYSPGRAERPGYRMRAEMTTISDALADAGYRCGLAGPWHLGWDERPQHGFESWHPYRYVHGQPDPLASWFAENGVANRYVKGAPGVTDDGLRMGYTTFDDPREQRTTWTVDRGCEFLAAADERPSFLFLSVKDPHPLIVAPPDEAAAYAAMDLPLPATLRASLADKPLYQQTEIGRLPEHCTDDAFRKMLAHYYALITHIDTQVGRIVAQVRASGRANRTVIAFISDHGEMLGDHGFTTKRLFYEASVRVPMLWWGAGNIAAGRRMTTPIGGVDLAPTLAELADAGTMRDGDGRSVAVALVTGTEPDAAPVFAEIATWQAIQGRTDDDTQLAARVMVRDGDWKYVHARDGEHELYNLAVDPMETLNAINTPDAPDVVRRMRVQLAEMLKRTGPGVYAWAG
jgi:arylsulfatase A-like enzyme